MSSSLFLVRIYQLRYCFSVCLESKNTTWKTWLSFPDVTEVFIRLVDLQDISAGDKGKLERFVCLMYGRTSPVSEVNQCRRLLFVKKAHMIENFPPTSNNALIEHIKPSQERSHKWARWFSVSQVVNVAKSFTRS